MPDQRGMPSPNELDMVLGRIGFIPETEEMEELREAFERLNDLTARLRRGNQPCDAEILPVHVPLRGSTR